MDHQETRAQLDIAATEPGGLDRLMAGDTPAAIAVAGHLAGCEDCTQEFGRLRRASAVLREVIATQPPADLRERTLAFVAAVGRPRGDVPQLAPAGFAGSGGTASHLVATAGSASGAPAGTSRRRAVRGPWAWLAAAAALVLVTGGVTAFGVASIKDGENQTASRQLDGLAEVAAWTMRLDAQPDVQRVQLVAATDAAASGQGSLVFSPSSGEMVVVAQGLAAPADGKEYRCWVEFAGTRQRLGRMYASGDLSYWVGDAPLLAGVPAGSVFGVSLADIGGSGGAGPAVVSGILR